MLNAEQVHERRVMLRKASSSLLELRDTLKTMEREENKWIALRFLVSLSVSVLVFISVNLTMF